MKDFYQYASPTRVIAGRDLLGSTGFELQKEGARRVFLVTDAVIRGTGLVERVEAGVTDGGLEVAGVFDGVPQDSSTDVVERCALHPRRERPGAGGVLPDAPRGRGDGPAARHRAARVHPHHRRHGQ